MNETWLPISGWEGLYEVSDMGNVRSLPRERIVRAGSRKMTFKGRILVGGLNRGYANVNFRDSGRHKSYYVHWLVLTTFVGPKPDGYEACHWNGIRTDNRLANLRWDTQEANMQDRRRHGMNLPGERNHNAILTEAAVREIRNSGKAEVLDLASRFGVSHSCIVSVRRRGSWKHID
jgi:hypothetical protein